ncbi:MAG: hypothetical protein R3E58_02720 [Phycisphaerae bacterium]
MLPGVLNIVHGLAVQAGALVTHPDVPTIAFTGGTAIALRGSPAMQLPCSRRLVWNLAAKIPTSSADADWMCIGRQRSIISREPGASVPLRFADVCRCSIFDAFVTRFVERAKVESRRSAR